jgi:hypothetical protein
LSFLCSELEAKRSSYFDFVRYSGYFDFIRLL